MSNDEGMSNDDKRDFSDLAFWFDDSSAVREEPSDSPKYDLEERTARFGEAVIDFAKTIPRNPATNRLILSWSARERASAQTIVKRTTLSHGKSFFFALERVEKKHGKRNISCAWLSALSLI